MPPCSWSSTWIPTLAKLWKEPTYTFLSTGASVSTPTVPFSRQPNWSFMWGHLGLTGGTHRSPGWLAGWGFLHTGAEPEPSSPSVNFPMLNLSNVKGLCPTPANASLACLLPYFVHSTHPSNRLQKQLFPEPQYSRVHYRVIGQHVYYLGLPILTIYLTGSRITQETRLWQYL